MANNISTQRHSAHSAGAEFSSALPQCSLCLCVEKLLNQDSSRKRIEQISVLHCVLIFLSALLLLLGALVINASAQEARPRSASSSLTSLDLLDSRSANRPQPSASAPARVRPSERTSASGASLYRDPSGAFALNLPNGNWRVSAKKSSAGAFNNQRTFRRIEAEGFASATASVYVINGGANFSLGDASRLSPQQQRELASALAARFLSSSNSLVTVEAGSANARQGLRIIADQIIARRTVVRASINAFERQGRVYVIVCCAPPESFDTALADFNAITESLAASVTRS